jgi:hypothetical protein
MRRNYVPIAFADQKAPYGSKISLKKPGSLTFLKILTILLMQRKMIIGTSICICQGITGPP